MFQPRNKSHACNTSLAHKNSGIGIISSALFVASTLAAMIPSIALAETPLNNQQSSPLTPTWIFYATMVIVTFSLIYGLKRLSNSLTSTKWKMSEALSEEVIEVTNGSPSTVKTADGSPQLAASSSRLLLAIGMIIMSSMYVGVGYFVLWAIFYAPERLKDFDSLSKFFISGSALFAPYAVNKLSEVFKK